MKRRITAILLALIMLAALAPIQSAFALGGFVRVFIRSGLPGVAEIIHSTGDGALVVYSQDEFVNNGTFLRIKIGDVVYTRYRLPDVPESFGRTDLLCWKITTNSGDRLVLQPGNIIGDTGEGADFYLDAIWDGLETNSYAFSAPTSVTVTENAGTVTIPFTLSELTLGSADNLTVSLLPGVFTDGENTISYEDGVKASFTENGQTKNCTLRISADEWANAKAGCYTATLQYRVTFELGSLNTAIRTFYGSVPMTLQVGHTITVSVNEPSRGTASASAAMAREGETVTLTAAPADDRFGLRSWSVQSGGVSVSDGNTFVMGNEDVSVKAIFDVLYNAGFINYDVTILYVDRVYKGDTPVYAGETPTKPSTERYDYFFTGWDPAIGPITEDTVYTAQYREEKKNLVTFNANGGSGEMATESYYVSDGTYTLPQCGFTAPDGYVFDNWLVEWDNGDGTTTAQTRGAGYTLRGLDKDIRLTAQWKALAVRVSPEGAGTAAYDSGTFTATANAGYTFREWDYYPDDSGVTPVGYEPLLSTKNPYTPETVAEGVYYAIFTRNEYSLTVQANDAARGTASYTGTPQTGRKITLTATPNEGYVFKKWQTVPEGIVIDANNRFTMPPCNVTVTAVFVPEFGEVIVSGPIEHGSVVATGQARYGDTVVLTVIPDQGAVLMSLVCTDEDGVEIPITDYSFTMPPGSVTVTATFGPKYVVTLEPGRAGGEPVTITSLDEAWADDWRSAANGQFYVDSITGKDGFRYPDCPFTWDEHSFNRWQRKDNLWENNAGSIMDAGTYTLIALWSMPDGYYLIGPEERYIDIDPDNRFTVNPENEDEYILSTVLKKDERILVVQVENSQIKEWYPDNYYAYLVDNAHAGDVNIYFRTSYYRDWVVFGGYFCVESSKPSFVSQSLTLGSEIGVSFYVNLNSLSNDERTASKMTFTVSGRGANDLETKEVAFDSANTKATGVYYFTCRVNALQMADTITATFHYGDDDKTVEKTYSVKEYIETWDALHPGDTSSTTALIRALADYGHYVQPFLAGVHGFEIGAGNDKYAEMDAFYAEGYDPTQLDLDDYPMTVDPDPDYVVVDDPVFGSPTMSLVLDSETAIRIYFNRFDDSVAFDDGFTVTVWKEGRMDPLSQEDGDYTVTKVGDRYMVQINGVKASRLLDLFTIMAKNGTDETAATQTVDVKAVSYVGRLLNSATWGSNTDAQNAVCALWAYAQAAANY